MKDDYPEEELTEEEKELRLLGISEKETRLLRQTSRHVSRIPYLFIMIGFFVYVWIRFYDYFTQNTFFLIYSAAVYCMPVVMGLWATMYQIRTNRLFKKLIVLLRSKSVSPFKGKENRIDP